MSTHFIRYYLFKDSIRFMNSNVSYLQDTSNQTLFHYALFYDASEFYKIKNPFKKDPYQISDEIKNHFFPFLKECLENAYFHADASEKLFCYYLILSYISSFYLKEYIDGNLRGIHKKIDFERMLETYFFNKNEKLKLYRTNIADYFFESFEIKESELNLLEPVIKRQFGFFCTKNYYLECYSSARYYFDHLANSRIGFKKIAYFFYDLFLNHRKNKRKAKTYPYPKKIDTSILNLNHQSYSLFGQEVQYSFDEFYKELLKEARKACEALNAYFIGNQNLKPLLKYMGDFPANHIQ